MSSIRVRWLLVGQSSSTSILEGNLLDSENWAWGLSLIAITVAIHATGVVLIALVGFGVRADLEGRRLGLQHLIPITIGIIGAVGLLLVAGCAARH